MEYIIGTLIGAVIALIGGIITAKLNNRTVERTTSKSLEEYSKLLIKDLEKTGQEIQAKIGVEVLSKYRQAWINDLRKTINDTYHLINISTIKLNTSIRSGKIDKPVIEEIHKNIYKVKKLRNYLELLLNPLEESYEKITEAIELVPSHLQSIFDTAVEYSDKKISKDNAEAIMNIHLVQIDGLKKQILKSTQQVLKEEWERVKKGV